MKLRKMSLLHKHIHFQAIPSLVNYFKHYFDLTKYVQVFARLQIQAMTLENLCKLVFIKLNSVLNVKISLIICDHQ